MSRRLSSLRYRFFLALGGVLLLAVMALAVIAKLLVVPALLDKESQYAGAELDRAQRAIDNELEHLSLLTKDWAYWDASYEFVQGRRPDYLDSNLADGLVFEEDELRMMVFLHADGSLYLAAGLAPDDDAYHLCYRLDGACRWAAPLVDSVRRRAREGFGDSRATWLIGKPERAMVSMWPILESDGGGPSAGWLAMIRVMDDDWLARLNQSTGVDLSLTVVSSLGPHRLGSTLSRPDTQTMLATRRLEADPGPFDLELRARLPRESFRASLETFRFALYWTLGLLVVVLVVVLVLLETMVLAPLRRLAIFAQQARLDGSREISFIAQTRDDEIGILSREFRHLLDHQQRQTSSLVALSQHDPLTGLANRRLFNDHLDQALDHAARTRSWLALVMVDIDHFKAYNDRYGHPAGDRCLVAIAQCMQRQFDQPGQLVARTGGEEFMIVLPGYAEGSGLHAAEALRHAVEALGLPHADSPIASVVTISLGVALYSPRAPCQTNRLIAAADAALYAAKQGGRNTSRVAADGATA
ncbi:GGDEF domain-containing protein [Modicisalibacter coralii]|uniref:GGDEF domain-containing protein n=1 Tax=Modicisalibacter coralii TaxID=2304602 RepID=UPI00100B52BA|nr:diguanylate cyclase [Halomonas coralii]